MTIGLKHFYKTYLDSLDAGDAAMFIGAGLSRPAGFVDWRGLLREIAQDIGLDVDVETDLIAVAQYHFNQKRNRAQLNQKLIAEFTKHARSSDTHRLIANLPIQTIWTTNYDTLIEDAFRDIQKRPDVKSTQANLAQSMPGRDVTIYKMHGDISQPHEAVLTKDDYELYSKTRGLFTEKLQGDLVSKTFLFLGFSFSDPNIDYILGRLRVFLDTNTREHFCIMRRPDKPTGTAKSRRLAEYAATKYDLRSADLSRYGITTIDVADYAEIKNILGELNRSGHRKFVFVSGSAFDFEPFGKERLERFARLIGKAIIERDYNLVSGFGRGLGGQSIVGALESLYDNEQSRQERRTVLRPFPQKPPHGMTKEQFNTKYRTDMLAGVGAVIFICGNKPDPSTGKISAASGVYEEFEIAKQLGKYPIPIGATGHAAHKIWQEVRADLGKFFKSPAKVKRHFETIGDANQSDKRIVDAVFSIIEVANEV